MATASPLSCGTTRSIWKTYFAAPCMGAVLHTLNIRLAGEQIAFIANEAEDSVVLVDMSLVAVAGPGACRS